MPRARGSPAPIRNQPSEVCRPQWRLQRASLSQQGLRNLLRLTGVRMHIVANHPQRHLTKIGLKCTIEFGELRPQNLVDEASWSANHDGVASLSVITKRREPVPATQGQKQVTRPLVRQ